MGSDHASVSQFSPKNGCVFSAEVEVMKPFTLSQHERPCDRHVAADEHEFLRGGLDAASNHVVRGAAPMKLQTAIASGSRAFHA